LYLIPPETPYKLLLFKKSLPPLTPNNHPKLSGFSFVSGRDFTSNPVIFIYSGTLEFIE